MARREGCGEEGEVLAGGGGIKCFQRQLFRLGSLRGARSLRAERQLAEAERGMDWGLRSGLPSLSFPPPPLLPSASARCGGAGSACVRVREGRLGVRPRLAGGHPAWGYLAEPGVPGCAGACDSVRARLHAYLCVLV